MCKNAAWAVLEAVRVVEEVGDEQEIEIHQARMIDEVKKMDDEKQITRVVKCVWYK